MYSERLCLVLRDICLQKESVPGRNRDCHTISQFIAMATCKNILSPGNPHTQIMGLVQEPDSPKLQDAFK